MSNIEHSPFIPEWRQLCQAAWFETKPAKLLERITRARNAVLDRIEDLHSKSSSGEQAALRNALATLDNLRRRLVDPSRQFAVPTSYTWKKSYQAALLETDWTKMHECVQRAESEIHQRRLMLSQDHNGTDEERAALVDAMSALRVAASCRKPVQNERSPYPVFDSPDKAG